MPWQTGFAPLSEQEIVGGQRSHEYRHPETLRDLISGTGGREGDCLTSLKGGENSSEGRNVADRKVSCIQKT